MFRAHVLIARRSKVYYNILYCNIQVVHGTATYRFDDTRGCIVHFWPPGDEHMCSKHVEAWNKLIIKFSASSWLILRQIYWDARSAKYKKILKCAWAHSEVPPAPFFVFKSSRRSWNSPKLSLLELILCTQKHPFLVNKRLLHQILSINENTCTWFDILAVQKCQLYCFRFGSARLAMWIVTRSARFSSVRSGSARLGSALLAVWMRP